MLITSKGRYALRLMIFVAASGEGTKVTLRKVADSENISLKYLEQLAHTLTKAELLTSVRGHGGGYMLARPAGEIKAGDVIRAAEGSTAPVACAGLDDLCPRESMCSTVAFWAGLDQVIEDYVDGVTLADLAQTSFANLDIPAVEAGGAKPAAGVAAGNPIVPGATVGAGGPLDGAAAVAAANAPCGAKR